MVAARPGEALRAGKLATIQHLRAVAALGVVLFHSISQVYDGDLAYARMGAAGVDLFFIISGFIMWVTAVDRDERPSRFALKRIVRIVPLYWLVTSAVLVVVLVAPGLMHSARPDVAHIVASYGFVAWAHPQFPERFWPLLIPGWTLNYEMLFYVIVTGALFLERRWRLPVIAAALMGLVCIGAVLQPQSVLGFYTNPILLEFLLGVGIGASYTRGMLPPRPLACVAIGVAVVSFLMMGPLGTEANRMLSWGVPMALLVLGAVSVPRILPDRPFQLLGDASYSLYLTQFCVIGPGARMLGRLVGDGSVKWVTVVILVALACIVGVATYSLVERSVTKGLRSLLERGRFRLGSGRPRLQASTDARRVC